MNMSASASDAAGSSADRRQLEDLISLGADVELLFDDGTLMANSVVLSLFSIVLRGAVEANAGAASGVVEQGNKQSSSSSSDSEQRSIPLKGILKEEWLEVAALWYPVAPSCKLTDDEYFDAYVFSGEHWAHAEKAVKIGSQFDIKIVLEKVSRL
jgi:hypothetical protein